MNFAGGYVPGKVVELHGGTIRAMRCARHLRPLLSRVADRDVVFDPPIVRELATLFRPDNQVRDPDDSLLTQVATVPPRSASERTASPTRPTRSRQRRSWPVSEVGGACRLCQS